MKPCANRIVAGKCVVNCLLMAGHDEPCSVSLEAAQNMLELQKREQRRRLTALVKMWSAAWETP